MSYAEVVVKAGVNVVRRDEAFWLTESDWYFKKVFTWFLMYSWHEVFLSLTVFVFEGKEDALLFFHNRQLFFSNRYHICDQFLWTCPQKNICIANWLLLLNKRLKNESWKKTKIVGGKKESYFRRLFGPLHGKQEISKVLYIFFVWTVKSVERVFQTIIVKWKQSSSSQRKH